MPSVASSRLSKYVSRAGSGGSKSGADEYARRLVPALAARRYHLPGNNWKKDWIQYFANNHPVFGICCHHELHPIKRRQRIVGLVGSVAFGLAATNFVFLWFLRKREDMDEVAFKIDMRTNLTESVFDDTGYDSEVTITKGMVALWTFGGILHSMFDLSIWYVSACACCHPGGCLAFFGCCKHVGSYVVVAVVSVVVAVATFVVVLRASMASEQREAETDGTGGEGEDVEWGEVEGVESFSFLLGYGVELVLALFVYYPLMGTILFSGLLGCGRLPFLGGRPREMRCLRDARNMDLEQVPSGDTFQNEED